MDNASPPLIKPSTSGAEERSLVEDIKHLASDGRTLLEAEFAYQKSRAAVAGAGVKGIAGWAALALVAVNLIGLQAWAWKEQAALVAKKTSIRDVLTSTFPDVRVVLDAPLQMEQSLAILQRQSGATSNTDMEAMLGRFQAVAPEIPAPTAIEFVASELRLKMPTPIDGQLPGLVTRLQPYGYSVQSRDDTVVVKPGKRP